MRPTHDGVDGFGLAGFIISTRTPLAQSESRVWFQLSSFVICVASLDWVVIKAMHDCKSFGKLILLIAQILAAAIFCLLSAFSAFAQTFEKTRLGISDMSFTFLPH